MAECPAELLSVSIAPHRTSTRLTLKHPSGQMTIPSAVLILGQIDCATERGAPFGRLCHLGHDRIVDAVDS